MPKEMPEEIKRRIVTLFDEDSDQEITGAARIEAMMTFMKLRTGHDKPDRLIVPENCVDDKDRLFHFARIFQNSLLALYAGTMEVLPDIRELFENQEKELPLDE